MIDISAIFNELTNYKLFIYCCSLLVAPTVATTASNVTVVVASEFLHLLDC